MFSEWKMFAMQRHTPPIPFYRSNHSPILGTAKASLKWLRVYRKWKVEALENFWMWDTRYKIVWLKLCRHVQSRVAKQRSNEMKYRSSALPAKQSTHRQGVQQLAMPLRGPRSLYLFVRDEEDVNERKSTLEWRTAKRSSQATRQHSAFLPRSWTDNPFDAKHA